MVSSVENKLISCVGRHIPESRLRDQMRKIAHFYRSIREGVFYSRSASTTNVTFFKGPFQGRKLHFPDNGESMVFPELTAVRGYGLRYNLQEGDTVIDGGAYPGDWAALAGWAVGEKGKVLAFEPDPENHRYTKNMLAVNRITNVELYKLALNADGRPARMLQAGFGSTLIEYNQSAKTTGHVGVSSTTIDEFLINQAHPSLFVKLDVEGAEVDVVHGAEDTIRRWFPTFAIASYHEIERGVKSYTKLEPLLREQGYKHVETVHPNHLTTFAWM